MTNIETKLFITLAAIAMFALPIANASAHLPVPKHLMGKARG